MLVPFVSISYLASYLCDCQDLEFYEIVCLSSRPTLLPSFSSASQRLSPNAAFCSSTYTSSPYKSLKVMVWVLFVFTLGYSVASAFVKVFSCSPIDASWNLVDVATAKCIDRPVFCFAQAGLGIFADVATVLTPVPLLRTLHMPVKQEIGVAAILTMGSL